MEKGNLDKLKEDYTRLKRNYDLPAFECLNEAFDIEDLQDSETDFILRKIRRTIADRVSSYMRLIEMLINPNSPPMFVFKIIKKLSESDKKRLSDIYDSLSKQELEVLILDLEYCEENEAKFICLVFEGFQEIRKEMKEILGNIFEKEEVKNNFSGSYFG